MRSLYGRVSEEFYNEKLSKLHSMLEYINAPKEPKEAENDALWIDQGVLKIKKQNEFVPLNTTLFQSMDSLVSASRPVNPTPGQLWIDEGVLVFYDGIRWEPVKANMFESYKMDNYEPFIVLESLEAACNQVVTDQDKYLEENFVLKKGAKEVVLQKGSYVPNSNSIVVYMNGRLLPKDCYQEPSEYLITFLHAADEGEYVTVQYVPKDQINNEIPLKFHPYRIEEHQVITEATTTITLKKEALIGPYVLDVYLNGRYVPNSFYKQTNSKTITLLEQLLPDEEVIVYYIDKVTFNKDPDGINVAGEIVPYTQFLWPDSKLDKLFIGGHFYMDYTQVNDVTIQYPTSEVQGKTLSAVHVHPRHLYNIQKRLYQINKTTRFIQVDEYYSEIYAVRGDDTYLMIKSKKSDTDYTSVPGGILLSNRIATQYDYILSVQYEFSSFTGRGKLARKEFVITNDSQIDVGVIHDPLLVFAQGHYLIPKDNYEYSKDSGIVRLFFTELLDIGILTFPHAESGKLIQVTGSLGSITLQSEFKKPLVFIYGEHLQQLVDVTITGNTITVPNAKAGMSYMVVDCIDDAGYDMYEKEDYLKYDEVKGLYYVETENDYTDIDPILFIEGLLIAKKDVNFFPETKRLYLLNGGSTSQRYTLLQDGKQRYIHSDYRQDHTFSMNTYSNASMLYADGKLLHDVESVGVTELPKTGYQDEIKAIVTYNKGYVMNSWHRFNGTNWEVIEGETADFLTDHFAQYILEGRLIHFLDTDTLQGKSCYAFLYQYDYHVEHGLQYGIYSMTEDKRYQTYPRHHFSKGQNALSVYVEGIRQYPAAFNFENGIVEENENYFSLPQALLGETLEYVVEPPEFDERESCDLEIVSSQKVVDQIITTRNLLLPGFVTVFIDGIRQPKDNILIIDDFHLRIIGYHPDPRFENKILIEVRRDLYLNETSLAVSYDHQIFFPCDDIVLPQKILFTNDFLKIYYNGLFIGDRYRIDFGQKALIILDAFFENTCQKGDTLIIEWR